VVVVVPACLPAAEDLRTTFLCFAGFGSREVSMHLVPPHTRDEAYLLGGANYMYTRVRHDHRAYAQPGRACWRSNH
jgi:hypothetical protein